MDLVVAISLSLLLMVAALFTSGAFRITLGLVFVIFLPGYTLVAALFPRKDSLSGIERLGLSFGLSIATVSIIGVALNYTPWGIRFYPALISLFLFIALTAIIAWYRRRSLPPGERFELRFRLHPGPLFRSSLSQSGWNKVLSIILLVGIIGATSGLIYLMMQPRLEKGFTRFYILGLEGKAENYSRKITLGKEGAVVLGVENHEQKTATYIVEISINGEEVAERGPIVLNDMENWEQEIRFVPTTAGADQKVEFRLYKDVSSQPYLLLHLWITVEETP